MTVAELQEGQTFWWNGDEYIVVQISKPYPLYGGIFRDITTSERVVTLPVTKIVGQ